MKCVECKKRERRTLPHGIARDCNTCHGRKWALANPLRVAWNNLKKSAKRRRLSFALPFEEFVAVATLAGYLPGPNRCADGLSVHRIDSDLGYESGNVCFISMGLNSMIGTREFDMDALNENEPF